MADFTLCADDQCPSRARCRRSPASGAEVFGRQDWFGQSPRAEGADRCDQYWPTAEVIFTLDTPCVMDGDGMAHVAVVLSAHGDGGTVLLSLTHPLAPFACTYEPEARTVGFLAGNYLLHLIGTLDAAAGDPAGDVVTVDLATVAGLTGLPTVTIPGAMIGAVATAARAALAVNAPCRAGQILPSGRYPVYPAEAVAMLTRCRQ